MKHSAILALINNIHSGQYNEADKIVESELSVLALAHVDNVIDETADMLAGVEFNELELVDYSIDEGKESLKAYLTELSEEEITDEIVEAVVIQLDELKNANSTIEVELGEAKRIFKVNSKGKKRVKIQCPKGQKAMGNSCKPISGTEKIKRRKGALAAKKTKKAQGAGAKRRMVFKSKKAKQKRKAFNL